jgi:hypothetical protein
MSFKISYLSVCVALAASVGLVGCGGGDNQSQRVAQTVHAAQYQLVSVALKENTGYVHFKGFYQFELIGLQQDGTEVNLTNKASWTLSDSSVGKLKRGLLTASGVTGDVMLTVEYAGFPPITQSISISDAQLTSIVVTHPTGNVDECLTTELSAEAQFSNGITLPYPIKWVVTQGNENARFTDETRQVLSALNAGRVSVVAEGINNDGESVRSLPFTLDVNEALTGIDVSIDKSELRNGESANVTAVGRYGINGASADISDNLTLSADSNLLAINGLRITAQDARGPQNTVVLTAGCGGIDVSKDIIVKEQQIKSIDIHKNSSTTSSDSSSTSSASSSTASYTIRRGDRVDFNVKTTFSDDSVNNDYTYGVRWSIDLNGTGLSNSDVEITSSGELRVTDEIYLNSGTQILVIAELLDANDNPVKSQSGNDLKAEIRVSILL